MNWGKGLHTRYCVSCKRNRIKQDSKSGLCGRCYSGGNFQRLGSILKGVMKR